MTAPRPRFSFNPRLPKSPALVALLGFGLLVIVCGVPWIYVTGLVSLDRTSSTLRRRRANDVRRMMKAVGEQLATYAADNGAYPPMIPLAVGSQGSQGGSVTKNQEALTTYDPRFFQAQRRDPYSGANKQPFAYYTDGKRWILVTVGPNRRYDSRPPEVLLQSPILITGDDDYQIGGEGVD